MSFDVLLGVTTVLSKLRTGRDKIWCFIKNAAIIMRELEQPLDSISLGGIMAHYAMAYSSSQECQQSLDDIDKACADRATHMVHIKAAGELKVLLKSLSAGLLSSRK